jgi:hypothetical protein
VIGEDTHHEAISEDVNEIRADQTRWNNPHWHPADGGIYRNVRLYVTDRTERHTKSCKKGQYCEAND